MRWLLTTLLFTLSLLAPLPAAAHGGGAPQLTRVPVGPYLLYVWTSPEPWRVGQAHTTVAVTTLGAAGETPVTGAQVVVILALTDAPQQAIRAPAIEGKGANAGFYEADAELPAAGSWRVTVDVTGPAGSGQAGFDYPVQPEAHTLNWLLLGLGAALLLVVIGFGIIQMRKARRKAGEQSPAAAQRSTP